MLQQRKRRNNRKKKCLLWRGEERKKVWAAFNPTRSSWITFSHTILNLNDVTEPLTLFQCKSALSPLHLIASPLTQHVNTNLPSIEEIFVKFFSLQREIIFFIFSINVLTQRRLFFNEKIQLEMFRAFHYCEEALYIPNHKRAAFTFLLFLPLTRPSVFHQSSKFIFEMAWKLVRSRTFSKSFSSLFRTQLLPE